MQVAFAPGLFGILNQLPVVEPRTETTCDGLWVLGSIIMAEGIVGKS